MKTDPVSFSRLKSGDLVEGAILSKGANLILIDLGSQGTGVVYRGELQHARELVRTMHAGDRIHGKVINPDNEEGYVELSLSEATKQKAWLAVQELFEKGEPFSVTIKGANKGGLVTDIEGVQAFLPVSQLLTEHYPKESEDRHLFTKALQDLIGVEMKVKIADFNPRTNKLIVSERDALEVNAKELAKNYTVGQIIEGVVSGVADFGVFVRFTDNPALEGMIHVSELSHRVVENLKEVVQIDEVVKTKITDIKDGKIFLSLKALQEDPWLTAGETHHEGEEVKGTVYSFNPFGALINLKSGLQGQLHVTEFGGIEEMKKHLSLGKEVTCTIERVVPQERRILLKLKK